MGPDIDVVDAPDDCVCPGSKPLVNVYNAGPAIHFYYDPSQYGFPGHGRRDAFGAVSLDDGETWKVTNLSNSGYKSSYSIPAPGVAVPESILTDCGSVFCLTQANWTDIVGEPNGNLDVSGFSPYLAEPIEIVNGATKTLLFKVRSRRDGTFGTRIKRFIPDIEVPCSVQAIHGSDMSNIIAVADAPTTCVGPTYEPKLTVEYPGDVTDVFHAVAGDKVLAAWQSKYCSAGFPAWGSEYPVDDVATYLGIDNTIDLYLVDLFCVDESQDCVGDSQGATDYTEYEEFPGQYDDVGVVPHSCLWSARGVLREDQENLGTSEIVWFQAERLTSGLRDVNRIETACVAGAGCAITWQEDPEGLQPEAANVKWSGATTHSQTDIWYSFIEWKDFEIINVNGEPVPLADNILNTDRPIPFVPMMVPVRLTNNARCNIPITRLEETYCNEDFAGPYGIKDQCVGAVEIPLGPLGELFPICVVDSNNDNIMDAGDLPNLANTAASRPRLNLQPRDSDGDGVTDDAWIILIHEETKGLARFGFRNDIAWDGNLENTGEFCGDPDADLTDNCIRADIGKNQWYVSFAMGTPQTSVSECVESGVPSVGCECVESGVPSECVEYSMINNIVHQQNQYNAPEVNWITGTYFPPNSTADMWNFISRTIDLNFVIFNNEIATDPSLMTQPLNKAIDSTAHLMAMPQFKEGIIEEGPADLMARRILLEQVDQNSGEWQVETNTGLQMVDETKANPYDFRNMACEVYDGHGGYTLGRWVFSDRTNPYYPKGLCLAATINLSARTPYTCEVSGESDGVCPSFSDMSIVPPLPADLSCVDDPDTGQRCKYRLNKIPPPDLPDDITLLDKLTSWYQCPGWNGNCVGGVPTPCTTFMPQPCYQEPDSKLLMSNLDDRSWYLPTDIANPHGGFLDGDFISLIYTWSPNWKLNTVGRDRYEIYNRRSFDGGLSWTTMPASFVASNGMLSLGIGTTTCETWRDGGSHVCTVYTAGESEQSRNLSQLPSMLGTISNGTINQPIRSMPDECPAWYVNDGKCTKDVNGEYISDWLLFDPINLTNPLGGAPTDVFNPSRYFIVFETADNTTTASGESEPMNQYYGRAELFGDHYTVWAEVDTISNCYPNDPHGDPISISWGLPNTGFCNEFDTLEGVADPSKGASITASAYGDFLYGVWSPYNPSISGGEGMFRRVWYQDNYIPSSAWIWDKPPGP
jgi:hypothetical protein